MQGLNLLPWREWQRQCGVRRLYGLLFGVGLLAVLITWMADALGRQAQYLQMLESTAIQQAIDHFDVQLAQIAQHKVEHEQILRQQQALARLQGTRWLLVDLLEQLHGAVPQGVHLTSMTRQGARLQIQGLAHSGSLVAQLLRNLGGAIGEANMQRMGSVDEGEAFELSVVLRGET